MGNKTSKKSPLPPQLANHIVMTQPKHSDSLFIGDQYGRLQQKSIRQKKAIKNYGWVMESGILVLRTTLDKKHLFVCDSNGY